MAQQKNLRWPETAHVRHFTESDEWRQQFL